MFFILVSLLNVNISVTYFRRPQHCRRRPDVFSVGPSIARRRHEVSSSFFCKTLGLFYVAQGTLPARAFLNARGSSFILLLVTSD